MERWRDGRRAVLEATRACELTRWNDENCLDTLAAACAEAGDFSDAVKWVDRAGDDAQFQGGQAGGAVHFRGPACTLSQWTPLSRIITGGPRQCEPSLKTVGRYRRVRN